MRYVTAVPMTKLCVLCHGLGAADEAMRALIRHLRQRNGQDRSLYCQLDCFAVPAKTDIFCRARLPRRAAMRKKGDTLVSGFFAALRMTAGKKAGRKMAEFALIVVGASLCARPLLRRLPFAGEHIGSPYRAKGREAERSRPFSTKAVRRRKSDAEQRNKRPHKGRV